MIKADDASNIEITLSEQLFEDMLNTIEAGSDMVVFVRFSCCVVWPMMHDKIEITLSEIFLKDNSLFEAAMLSVVRGLVCLCVGRMIPSVSFHGVAVFMV